MHMIPELQCTYVYLKFRGPKFFCPMKKKWAKQIPSAYKSYTVKDVVNRNKH